MLRSIKCIFLFISLISIYTFCNSYLMMLVFIVLFLKVLNEIQKRVEMRQFLCEDDKDEIIFLVQKAKQAISEWKAHQL